MSYILGLDLGVQSIGWAIIVEDSGVKLGVRCFDSGTGTETEIEQGKDESRNLARRAARLVRRNLWRRKRRVLKTFNILRNHGLLPLGHGIGDTPEQRQERINELDKQLSIDFLSKNDRIAAHLLTYKLRALALDEPLPPFAFGRVLLHLAQRRGFLSNKKTQGKSGKSDEDQGKIKGDISALQTEIETKGVRTLGEYFASLDPEEKRIRTRWTGRKMFEDEFDKIWEAQTCLNPALNLTEELRKKIHHALFFQRPLKSQSHLIGKCQLEKTQRRALRASLEAQRFRYWQKILDLNYRNANGEITELTREQQDILAENLEITEKLTFPVMKKLLGFSKKKEMPKEVFTFNLETELEDEETKGGIRGNTIGAKIRKVLGEKWDCMSEEEQAQLVGEMLQFDNEDALARRLQKAYRFDSNTASQLAGISLEPDYAKLSKKAIRKILPIMIEKRISFKTAEKEIYGEQKDALREQVLDLLPPVLKAKPELRNPIVSRTLTEMRKVVNAIIRKYGKPEMIRVELARDMKKGRKERESLTKEMKQREKQRDVARKRILEECGIKDPKPRDIQKMLLAEECNWECPYTGKAISPTNLFGDSPQFDIEHIIPFSRSLDNSFINLTLCDVHENRHVKGNKTPFELYSSDLQKWRDILTRVKTFRGKAAAAKLRRFEMQEMPEGFTSRMLNDTRYISKVACEYLALLFGGQIDATGKRRIQVSSGGMTAYLRNEWDMNSILNDGGDAKNRDDHRHHAVDAAVIAMCEPRTVQLLSRAAERASELGLRRLFFKGGIEEPIPNFWQQTKDAVDEINISFRCNRKASGQLHDASNYSGPMIVMEGEGKKVKQIEYRHIRKPLANMSKGEIEDIVDPKVREIVLDKLARLDGDPKKFTENELPMFHGRPIRKARIRKKLSIVTVGQGYRERHVASGNNHHIEIIAVLDPAGNEVKWEGEVVSMFEARQRRQRKEPIIKRDHGANKRFKFSLAKDEYIEKQTEDNKWELWRVHGLTGNRIKISRHKDARKIADIEKESGTRPAVSTLQGKIRKVSVDLLGEIHPAND
ncbi:MAG: type II CRISPR RNA-guided endonuclease Cas9 [Thermoguttaceae bacterium]